MDIDFLLSIQTDLKYFLEHRDEDYILDKIIDDIDFLLDELNK